MNGLNSHSICSGKSKRRASCLLPSCMYTIMHCAHPSCDERSTLRRCYSSKAVAGWQSEVTL